MHRKTKLKSKRIRQITLQQPITRQSTGKLPPSRSLEVGGSTSSPSNTTVSAKVVVTNKATPEEIKEKLEQQLRLQRAAHHQKRALEMQKQTGKLIRSVEAFSFNKKLIFNTSFHLN